MRLPTAPRLTFRRMGAADLDLVHSLLGDPEVMTYYPRPKTRDECAIWIRRAEESYATHGYGLWILEDREGRFLGECGLLFQDIDGGRAEIGYHLLPSAQGQGFAAEAASACVEFARVRGFADVISIIAADNLPSRRVATRAGLRYWKDVDIFGGPKQVYRLELSASSVSSAT